MPANTRPAWQWTAALPLLLLAAGCTGMGGQPTATASKPVLEQEPVADFSSCSKPVEDAMIIPASGSVNRAARHTA